MIDFNKFKHKNPLEYSSLVLAYIGDAVYEIYVRAMLISDSDKHVDKLHKAASQIVKASSQCSAYHKIENLLNEEEKAVFRRGRNAKSTPPKNADVIEYKYATGLEALIGYIYLTENYTRLNEIMNIILNEA